MFCQFVQGQTESQSKFCKLKFEVSPLKDTYLPLEPIRFSYRISNPTDSPIEIWWSFPDVIFTLNVNKDNETRSPQLSNLKARKGITLIQPNEVFEGQQTLNYQLSNIFPENGKYELFFTIYGKESNKASGDKLVSSKVEITIQQPSGINAEALDFIYKTHKTPIVLGIFQNWEDKRENQIQTPLEEFVEKYGDSVYGDYAIYYLANSYKYTKRYDLAKKEFNKLKDRKNFAYEKEVIQALEEIDQDLLKSKLREKKN